VSARRIRLTPWDLRFHDDGTVREVRSRDGGTDDEWRRMSERIRDDLRDGVIPSEPALWAAEWVEVDGSVISYLDLVRRSVLAGWDKDAWRRALEAQLRGRLQR